MSTESSTAVAVKVTLTQHKTRGVGYGSYLFVSSSSPLLPTNSSNSQQFIGRYTDRRDSSPRLICTIKCPSKIATLTDMGRAMLELHRNPVTWLAVARMYHRGRSIKIYFPKRTGLELPSEKFILSGRVSLVTNSIWLLDIRYL